MDGPVENFEGHEDYEGQENYEGEETSGGRNNGDSHNFEEEEEVEEEEEEEEEEEGEEEQDPNNNAQLEEVNEEEATNGDNNNMQVQSGDNNNNGDDDFQGQIEQRWTGWPGENAFRILVPGHKVGAVIGHKGDIIKKMAEETKARIRILSSPNGVQERVVLVTAKEEPDFPVSPAMEGLFRVHKRIVDGLEPDSEPLQNNGTVPPTRLLVPGVQAAMVIGKQGATIKLIQENSGAVVRVSENVPPIALYDDRIVEIQGEPASMHKALGLISNYLRKFLIDRTVIPLYEAQMQHNIQNSQQGEQQQMPAQHQWGPPPPPQNYAAPPPPQNYAAPAGPGYGSHYPPPAHDNYYPPAENPPRYEKPPPYSTQTNQPAPHVISNVTVTQHMQIPLSYVDAVIGADGANISYIRRASGATVTVQETKGVPGEMTVEMVGSAAQVQTAQQLIQNFIADAAPPGVGASAAGPAAPATGEGGYGGYSSYGGSYGNAPPGGGGVPDPAGGQYGSGYSSNYGY